MYRYRKSYVNNKKIQNIPATAAAAMTGSTSAFTPCHNSHGTVIIPRRSFTLLPASIGMEMSRGSTIFDRSMNLIDNPSVEKHLNASNKRSCQEEKHNMDVDEWELRLYGDKTKSWEEVADALVQVTGSSDPDAFKTMISANKTGFARVGNKLCYEVAEMYNEGLQKQGILTELSKLLVTMVMMVTLLIVNGCEIKPRGIE